jgi:hypothetical protein
MCRHKFFTPGAVGSPCNEWIEVCVLVVYMYYWNVSYSIELKKIEVFFGYDFNSLVSSSFV